MSKEMPFDDDIMTLIMGVTPDEPGPHGRTQMPKPKGDAVSLVTQIRDMCEEFLMKCGKHDEEDGEGPEKPEKKDKPNFDDEEDEKEPEEE